MAEDNSSLRNFPLYATRLFLARFARYAAFLYRSLPSSLRSLRCFFVTLAS